MSAPYNFIHNKTESMAVLWLTSQTIGTEAIYQGKRSLDKAGQCVVCYVEKSVEDPPNSKNYRQVLKVIVRTPFGAAADDTSHASLVGKTFDALSMGHTTDPNYFRDTLSALVADYTVLGFFTPDVAMESGPDENNRWQDEMRLGIYCCGADIS